MVITKVQVVIGKRPGEVGDIAEKTFTFTGEGYIASPADTVLYPRDLRLLDMLNETIKRYNGEIRKPQEYAEQLEGRATRSTPPLVLPAQGERLLPPGSQSPTISRAHLQAVPNLTASITADPTGQGRY